jgi:hypothetical protein
MVSVPEIKMLGKGLGAFETFMQPHVRILTIHWGTDDFEAF